MWFSHSILQSVPAPLTQLDLERSGLLFALLIAVSYYALLPNHQRNQNTVAV